MKKSIVVFVLYGSCAGAGWAGDAGPSSVQNPVKESELTTVTLSPEGEQRLRLKTELVTREHVVRQALYPAKVLPYRASEELVIADETFTPMVKHTLAQRQIAADEKIAIQEAKLKEARLALARLENLVKTALASQKELEAQQTAVATCEASLTAARKERALLDIGTGELAALVKIYAGDWGNVNLEADIAVVGIHGASQNINWVAKPSGVRPYSEGNVVNVLYKIEKPEHLYAGQHVGARLPLKTSGTFWCVPGKSVITDIHGNDYVYVKVGTNTYARKRVEVVQRQGGKVFVSKGLDGSETVITDGAAEVFGSEFGFGK